MLCSECGKTVTNSQAHYIPVQTITRQGRIEPGRRVVCATCHKELTERKPTHDAAEG